MDVQYLEVEGASYPYKTGYKVFKDFQTAKGKNAADFINLTMEEIVYLHYLGMKAGAKADKEACKFKTFDSFEDFIDSDFNLFKKFEDVFLKFMPDVPDEESGN